jgi:segregation and condensation protein B
MQEESGSVTNTAEQNENTAAANEVAKSAAKKSAKKKGPKIPTVTEIVEKEGSAEEPAKEAEGAAPETKPEQRKEPESPAKEKPEASAKEASVKEASAKETKAPAPEAESPTKEAVDSDEKSDYPEEDTEEDEETARARANLNLDSETALIEAILFLESEPQNTENLAKISQLSEDVVKEALARLRENFSNADSGIEIAEIIGGWMLVPKKESFDLVKEKYGKKNEGRLSKAAIETLSIIAYSQPITRAEIESIRHVNADNMMRILLDRHFIKEVGKKDIPGKPILYGTTKEFLEFFHLQSIADLPQLDEKESERFELAR